MYNTIKYYFFLLLFISILFASPIDSPNKISKSTANHSKILLLDGAKLIIGHEAKVIIKDDNIILTKGATIIREDTYIPPINQSNIENVNIATVHSLPTELSISKAYPNPFNPSINISYGLPIDSDVNIIIHDLSGRIIAEYYQNAQSAGWHEFRWDAIDTSGNSIGSGIYLLTIHAGDVVKKQKLTFIK